MSLYLFCTFVILLAFGGEALFGFGGGLVAVPLISLVIDVRDAVVLVSVFQFLVGFLIIKNYRSVAWHLMPPLLVGMFAGVFVGVYALSVLSVSVLRILLAIFIFAFLTKTFFAPKFAVKAPSVAAGAASGFLAGFFQGCLSMGGPNLVIYLKDLLPDPRAFRASMIFWLSVANVIRIPFTDQGNLYSPVVVELTPMILPVFIIGTILGQRFHQRIPASLYFRTVYVFLFLAAASLLIRTVMAR
jgi:uncharacterized membrane protein YfcA